MSKTERVTVEQFIRRGLQADLDGGRITVSRPEFSNSWVERVCHDDDMYRIEWVTPDDGKDGEYIASRLGEVVFLDVNWLTPAPPELPPLPDQYRFNKSSWYYEHYDTATDKWQRIIELDENFSIVIFEKLWFAHEITTLQAILAHAAAMAKRAEV